MITDGMAFGFDPIKKCLMLFHVITNAKEGRFCVCAFQFIQHKLSGAWYRSIIKGEVDNLSVSRNSPDQFRVE